MSQQTPDEETLRQHKRECFDGMRAYHESEISHSNHAVTMLLSLAGAVGAVVLGMLFPQTPPAHVREIGWGLFGATVILGLTIAITGHMKINSDHKSYARFGTGYVAVADRLGLFGDSSTGDVASTSVLAAADRQLGQGKGYRRTQRIIWSYAGALMLLALVFAVAAPNIAEKKPQGAAPCTSGPTATGFEAAPANAPIDRSERNPSRYAI